MSEETGHHVPVRAREGNAGFVQVNHWLAEVGGSCYHWISRGESNMMDQKSCIHFARLTSCFFYLSSSNSLTLRMVIAWLEEIGMLHWLSVFHCLLNILILTLYSFNIFKGVVDPALFWQSIDSVGRSFCHSGHEELWSSFGYCEWDCLGQDCSRSGRYPSGWKFVLHVAGNSSYQYLGSSLHGTTIWTQHSCRFRYESFSLDCSFLVGSCSPHISSSRIIHPCPLHTSQSLCI